MHVSPVIVAAFSDVTIFQIQIGYLVFGFGALTTLEDFGFLPFRADRAKAEIGMNKWRRALKFFGPTVALLGLVLIALAQ